MTNPPAADIRRPILRRAAQLTAQIFAMGAVLFGSAGRLSWTRGWIYFGLYLFGIAVSSIVTIRKNPEVIAARSKTHHSEAKAFDKLFIKLMVPLSFLTLAVAGLDAVRFGWSSMPPAAVYPGVIVNALSIVPVLWALLTNPFLETMVRIQHERGHYVVTSGPYRFVRHPMYAGVLLHNLSMPLVLGSWWAYVPAILSNALFVWRTAREDRTLRDELSGYEAYTGQTRYRLLPGVW